MQTILFVPDLLGIQALSRTAAMAAAMKARAEQVALKARQDAPIDDGDYQKGIVTDTEMGSEGVAGIAAATDWKSRLVEFGTVDTPTFATMRHAVEAAGLTLSARKAGD